MPITRLGSNGFGTRRTGSFAGRSLFVPTIPPRDIGYTPAPVPYLIEDLTRYTEDELYRIADTIAKIVDGYDRVVYAEPPRPREGDRVLADGTTWNPGGGKGVYSYYNGTWNKLG